MQKITIIDADQSVLSLTSQFFKADYDVYTFECAEKCIQYCRTSATFSDYVIIDYQMPQISGIELYQRLKGCNPKSKFVGLCSTARGQIAIDMAKRGLRDYVIKDRYLLKNLSRVLNGGMS